MNNKHPGREACLQLLKDYNTPEHVIRHCISVTETALKIANALIDKGFDFDVELIQSAGLIHDIARVEDKHGEVGADFAMSLGYKAEADIIRIHMVHTFDTDPDRLTEVDLVCLGDRLVLEDQYVGVDLRMQYVLEKVKDRPEIHRLIMRKKKVTQELVSNIEDIIGISIDELCKPNKTEKKDNI